MSLIPATIITGFLGAGKTTLLKRVLTEAHGQKIAVIENEFGEENIDNDILVSEEGEQIIQMSNGCVCCTIREDLRATLSDLASRKRAGTLDFERVIIETTGLADPGPVAQTFFMDDEVAERYQLDAVLTLVDAKHAMRQLDERLEVQRQIGFADQIFISKADLISPAELHALQHRLAHINPRAPQTVVHFGQVPLDKVLNLHGFNLNAKLDIDPSFLSPDAHAHPHDRSGCDHEHGHCAHEGHHHDHHHAHEHAHGDHSGCDHEHGHCAHEGHHHDHHHAHEHAHGDHSGCDHEHGHCTHEHGHAHHHRHDDDVKSFVFRADKPFDAAKLEDFLGAIVNIYGPRMYRYKGVLAVKGVQRKVIFQGVHQLMGSDLGPAWKTGEPRVSKMVFIGTELPHDILEQGLKQSLAA